MDPYTLFENLAHLATPTFFIQTKVYSHINVDGLIFNILFYLRFILITIFVEFSFSIGLKWKFNISFKKLLQIDYFKKNSVRILEKKNYYYIIYRIIIFV